MNKIAILTVLSLLMLPLSIAAQDEATEAYTYATYFYCDTGNEEAADEWVKKHMAPAYDAAVDDGKMTAWGWMAHHTGGKWRRILYRGSTSVMGALGTLDIELPGVADDDPGTGVSCKAHEDYLWKAEAGSAGNATVERGPVGESVYFVCNMNRESRADELVRTKFAAVYDQHVANGGITSWGWMSHVIGGEYRRLLTVTAADWEKLIGARESILETIGDMEGSEEFTEICYSHSDYLWDIQHEKP